MKSLQRKKMSNSNGDFDAQNGHHTDVLVRPTGAGAGKQLAQENARLVLENARLKSERDSLRMLIDSLPDYIFIKDRQSRFLTSNPAHLRALGASSLDEVMGKTDLDIFPAKLARQYYKDEQELMQSGQPLNRQEMTVDLQTGEERWLQTTKVPLRNDQGIVVGLMGISRDVSKRKHAEKAMAEAHRLLEAILDNVPDSIYVKDTQGRFLKLSKSVAHRLGVEAPALAVGKTDFDFNPAENARQYAQDDQRVMQIGQPVVNKIERHNLPGGEVSWTSTTKVPLRNREDEIIGLVGISRDITDLKCAEQALRESYEDLEQRVVERAAEISRERQLLRTVVDNLPDVVYAKDTKGRKILSNPADVEMAGRKSETEVIGKTDFDLFPKDTAEGFLVDDQKVMQGEAVINREGHFFDAKGHKHWLLTSKLPLRDQNKKIVGLVGIGRDITERKQAEEALQNNECFLRLVMDLVPHFIFVKDRESRHLLVNRACAQAANRTPEQMVGMSDLDLSSNRVQAEAFMKDDQEVIASGRPKSSEEKLTDANGRTRILQTVKMPVPSSTVAYPVTGGRKPAIVGVAVDVTALKEAETALNRERSLLRTLIDNLPDGIYAKDSAGRKILANPTDVRTCHCQTEAGAIGKTDFDFFSKEVAEKFWADDRKVLQGQPVINREEYLLDEKGEKRWLLTSKLPLHDQTNEIVGLVGIGRDITEQREAAEALRASEGKLRQFTTQLERSNRELQDFAYVASHDLQEPLRKIVVFGERLREQSAEKLDDTARDFLERMQKAASRMQTLINDLLAFSRVTTKARPFTQIDLGVMAHEVVNDLEGRIEMVKGRVEVGTLPLIDAEPVQMRQLFQNLIGNALKFRRPDTPPVVKVAAQIVTGPSPDGNTTVTKKFCRLTVSDNGIGFDEKYLDRIFNVFQRLHSRNEYEGTGMGLAITRKIVLFHRGDITAQSKPGEGTTFIVTLPVTHPKEPQTAGENHE